MSMKTSLVQYLRSVSAVTDLVSTRIRLSTSEQSDGNNPRVTIQQIDGDDKRHLAAATGKKIGLFQVNSYGATPVKAAAIADAIRDALHGYRGEMNNDVFVSSCFLESERDETVPPTPGSADALDGIQQDYRIGWSVSIPTFA